MDKVFKKGVEIVFVLQKMDVAFLIELVKQLADSPVCQHFFRCASLIFQKLP